MRESDRSDDVGLIWKRLSPRLASSKPAIRRYVPARVGTWAESEGASERGDFPRLSEAGLLKNEERRNEISEVRVVEIIA